MGKQGPQPKRRTHLQDGISRECAWNYYEGGETCVPHHPVFLSFPPTPLADANDDEAYVADFLGVRQRASYYDNLDRHVRHMCPATRAAAVKARRHGQSAVLEWPLVDEEYFQHVDTLASVLEAWHAGAEDFGVVELGTSFLAPWAAKAVAAWRRLVPNGRCRVGLAEFVDADAAELRGALGRLGLAGCDARVWNVDVRQSGLPELLHDFGTIDYLDMDIDGPELEVVLKSRAFLRERVRRLHIGTHARHTHYALKEALLADGWELVWSFPSNAYVETRYGRVAFLDGVLGVVSAEAHWRRGAR